MARLPAVLVPKRSCQNAAVYRRLLKQANCGIILIYMTHWKQDILVALLLMFIVTRIVFLPMSRRRILLIYLRSTSLIAHQNLSPKDEGQNI